MLERIIEYSVKNRGLVILLAAIGSLWGVWAVKTIPLDAIPDLSDVQVIIMTDYADQAPQIVEDQVTYPLTTAMLAVPRAKTVRGYSFFGSSFVYVIFEDGTDIYWARSRVLEYLNFVSKRLPKEAVPSLGPDATGVGWVYEYALIDRTGKLDLAQLRSIQDWFVRYELQTVSGVAEVASIGGYVKQYQVEIDPTRLAAYGIPLENIRKAIERSNSATGGRLIEFAGMEFMVRAIGYITSVDDLKSVVVGVDAGGTPILIRDIANVSIGPELRRGVAELDGEGEVAGGIVVMRYGKNALDVIENVKAKLESIKPGLPAGVEIIPVYDRSDLIIRAVGFLKGKLLEESLIVAAVCLFFLGNMGSALVAVLTLPLGVMAAFIVMNYQGINANIMSLGGIAIAIGAMVDAAVVMIENAHKKLETLPPGGDPRKAVIDAAKQTGPALFYCLMIITISFLPVFALEAQEGRLFRPLAFTKSYAMAAAAGLAVTVVPVMMTYLIRGKIKPEGENRLNAALIRWYVPLIRLALSQPRKTIAIACAFLAVSAIPALRLGTEFMPPLNEGILLYMPTTMPEISIAKAKEILQQTDRAIKAVPEVKRVFGKVGRAETATDPAPLAMLETIITLKPQDEWRPGMTLEKITAELDRVTKLPGVSNSWTMPVRTRIDMLSTGIKTPVGLKISGPDLLKIQDIGLKAESILRQIPGTKSVYAERSAGGKYIDFEVNRLEAARYGLTVGDVQDVIATAIGGMNVTSSVEGRERYPINVRYSRELRDNITGLERVLIPTPRGEFIPMAQVAKIVIRSGPPEIKSENARLNSWVFIDLSDRDVGGYVAEAQKALSAQLEIPPGYAIDWSGQYEYIERAKERLLLVVPLTALLIFLLLYLTFRKTGPSVIVMLSLPFALVGGVWLVYIAGYNMSVAVGVGFIALGGVAAEIGVLKLVYIQSAVQERAMLAGVTQLSRGEFIEGIIDGAAKRIRPIAMTVCAIAGGLLPIMWGNGTGSEVMKRIAAPMVGGILSAAILALLIIPVLYFIFYAPQEPQALDPSIASQSARSRKNAIPEQN